MTISYTLDVSQTSARSFFRLITRWRGSVWKVVAFPLLLWTLAYLSISFIYRYVLDERQQEWFEALARYLGTNIDSMIPLTFMLGFFVSFVVSRWSHMLNGIGWIDDSAMLFAAYIVGDDDDTRIARRTLVRYMVLTQTLVLRDISLQVRKRFPTIETLAAANLLTPEEKERLEEVHDPYSRYWLPIQWCYKILHNCRQDGRIADSYLYVKIKEEIASFRHGLSSLLKYDWISIMLAYPQVIFVSVRVYFILCLVSRQFLVREGAKHRSEIDLWIPITTILQLICYVGWMGVAEALLNPLGQDDDDLECNCIIDKNLITGMTLVDEGIRQLPPQRRDGFWNDTYIAPLYSMEAASRSVHPFVGSACNVNLVKGKTEIVMTPHKNQLSEMSADEQSRRLRRVDVCEYNAKHRELKMHAKDNSPDHVLNRIRRQSKERVGMVTTVGLEDGGLSAWRSTPIWMMTGNRTGDAALTTIVVETA